MYTGPVGRLLAISELSESDERISSQRRRIPRAVRNIRLEILLKFTWIPWKADRTAIIIGHRSNFHDFNPRASCHHRNFFVFKPRVFADSNVQEFYRWKLKFRVTDEFFFFFFFGLEINIELRDATELRGIKDERFKKFWIFCVFLISERNIKLEIFE